KSTIKYGNEYSLRKRLKLILRDILGPYKTTVDRLFGNHEVFISKLVDTRNYLTHYTKQPNTVVDLQKQLNFVQSLKLLMQLCFLAEMGFPQEKVEELMKNHYRGDF
ncbi:MAG: hypothetical protein H7Y11_15870, partial [Armatimonadetes bacterium]|nr:hypothetical protein [Anaerolineae bacterium]